MLQPAAAPRRQPIPKLGCGYAVCAVLAVAGLGLLFAAQDKWRKGQVADAWIVGAMGGFVCLLALGLIAPMQRTVAAAKARRQREEARPGEPWTWDTTWLDPIGIPQSGRRHGRVMLFAGIVAMVASLPGVFAISKELARGNYGVLAVLLFPAIGIGFLSIAATDWLRRRKYGLARFVPQSLPIPFGGELVGMVMVNRSIASTGTGRVALDCHRTTVTRHGNKRRTRDEVVAHTEREISPADWISAVGESRLFVHLPIRGGEATSMTPLEVGYPTFEWRLRVQVPTAGPDFVAEFVLPVFESVRGGATGGPHA